MDEKEIWKDIDGIDNYQVSSLGRVRNKETRKLRALPTNKNGYVVLVFRTQDGKTKSFYIHRLVALTFVENSSDKPCVDHINTIRTDNRASNLRWVTRKENQNNEITHTKMVKFANSDKHFKKSVFQYSLEGDYLAEFKSFAAAGRITGIHPTSISACIRGISKRGGKYLWSLSKADHIHVPKFKRV